MKNKLLILSVFSMLSCSLDENLITDSDGIESVCGNLIEEPGEECDSDFQCVSCKYPRMIFINTSKILTAADIGHSSLEDLDIDVWTGTLSDGSSSNANCNNWTTTTDEFFGTVGMTNSIMKDWTSSDDYGSCSDSKYFYCVESEYTQ